VDNMIFSNTVIFERPSVIFPLHISFILSLLTHFL
jgi:hypothetical protein